LENTENWSSKAQVHPNCSEHKKFHNLLPLNEENNKLNAERMKSLFYTEKKQRNFVVQYCCRLVYKWDMSSTSQQQKCKSLKIT
jgi:hypothetical protein